MGLGSGIEAGKAFVKFVLEDKELKSGLLSVGKKFQKFGSIGAAATAPIIAALGGAVRAFVAAGDELDKMSLRTGVSVENLSELKYAAGQTGTSVGTIEKALKKMATTVYEAGRGTVTHTDALNELGLSFQDLDGLSPDQQFHKISMAIAAIEDPTIKAALAQKIFGRAGTELLPMLSEGESGIAALRARAHELGLTLDTEAATAAAKLGDQIDDVKQQVFAMAVQVGAAVAGPLTEFLTWAQTILGKVIAWIKANPTLVRTIAAVTLGIAAASTAAIVFGTVLAIISAHPIIAALTLISGLVLGIATYFGFASSGAKDFKKELSGLKKPGGGNQVDPVAQQQADEVVRQLEGAARGPSAAIDSEAADRAEKASADQLGDVVKWTKATAEGVGRLVALAQQGGGFLAGSG